MALDPFDLLGTWRLERWEVERADGSVGRPLGPRPEGISIYGEDGWMSCTMTAGNRAPLSGANARHAPEAERAAAFSSLLAYCCRWRVEGDEVLHRVEAPAKAGTDATEALLAAERKADATDAEKVFAGAAAAGAWPMEVAQPGGKPGEGPLAEERRELTVRASPGRRGLRGGTRAAGNA